MSYTENMKPILINQLNDLVYMFNSSGINLIKVDDLYLFEEDYDLYEYAEDEKELINWTTTYSMDYKFYIPEDELKNLDFEETELYGVYLTDEISGFILMSNNNPIMVNYGSI